VTVLVLSAPDDHTAGRVCQALSERGHEPVRIDLGAFPSELSFSAAGPDWDGALHTGDREVRWSRISAVYYRRPSGFRFPPHLDDQQRRFAATETRQGLGGILCSLPVPFVNRPGAIADASLKPAQLRVAHEVGFAVPDTLITSIGTHARAFAERHGGQVIYKPFTMPVLEDAEEIRLVYATLVGAGDLDDASVALCPCQLQVFIRKRFDVRLTAVGQRCFAAAIHAGSPRAYVDWRADYPSLRYEPVTPPAGVTDAVARYLKRFGLTFGCFDFTIGPGPDGPDTWWFLECGPNAQWAWIQHETGLPIAEAIAEELAPR
jgi:ATP-grasp ribosomal peptide maturase